MARYFEPGSLVWAKFGEYPYWPAYIASEDVTKQLKAYKKTEGIGVIFFGPDPTYALVPEALIEDFEKSYTKHSKLEDDELNDEFEVAVKMAKENKVECDPPLLIFHKKSKTKKKLK